MFNNGPAMVSTGQQVNKWTARECETRRVGGTRPKKQKTLNATASNDEVYALAA